MEKIKIGLFDVFGYIIPGSLIFFSVIILLDKKIIEVNQIYENLNEISLSNTIALIIISFIIGISSHSIGYSFYRFWGPKIRKSRKVESFLLEYDRGKYLVLAREFSPNNMKHIEEWMAKRALCYNLSVGLVVLSIVGIVKLIQFPNFYSQWLFLSFGVLILSFLLLRRATSFNKWYLTDLYNTVTELGLKNKESGTK